MARRWCSISPPTRSTPGIYAAPPTGLLPRRRDRPDDPRAGRIDRRAEAARGRPGTDFAILDIHDLGIARERGLDLVGVMPIVQRPLAAVIARGDGAGAAPARPRGPHGRRHRPALRRSRGRLRGERRRRRPGEGRPGDDRLQRGRLAWPPGKVDAATGFWNAEGVALRSARGSRSASSRSTNTARPPIPSWCSHDRAARSRPGRNWSTRWSGLRAAATASRSRTPPRPSTT